MFYQVEKQIPDVLNPTQVQLDTAVQIDISDAKIIGISLKNVMTQISPAVNAI